MRATATTEEQAQGGFAMTSAEDEAVAQSKPAHLTAFSSHIGRTHRVNQDAGGAWTKMRADGTPATLLVVADGVSAGKQSEEASQLVVEILRQQVTPLLDDDAQDVDMLLTALNEATRLANDRVNERPYLAPSTADATTLVAVVCVGSEGGGVWCGDSRVYHLCDERVDRLTADHSWAEDVVRHGIMTPEQARNDRRAHMITRWLGPSGETPLELDGFRFTLGADQAVACCTDGLYAYFSPPSYQETEMAEILLNRQSQAQGAADELVATALQRGGHDDISVAVLRRGF